MTEFNENKAICWVNGHEVKFRDLKLSYIIIKLKGVKAKNWSW